MKPKSVAGPWARSMKKGKVGTSGSEAGRSRTQPRTLTGKGSMSGVLVSLRSPDLLELDTPYGQ